MSPRRLDAGAVVAAVGAVLLLVSLFLDWYGDRDEGYTAWTVFEVIDLLLAGIALVTISTFLSRAEIEPRLPRAPLLLLGSAALVLTASQLIDAPPAVALSDFDLQTGAWLALAGSALLLAGAFMSVARVSFSVEHREPRAGSPPPETETVKLTRTTSLPEQPYIAVVGAGDADAGQRAVAEEVGRLLAEAGAVVVTGGLGGVMEAASKGAREGGGTTLGLLPGTDRRDGNAWLSVAVPTGMGEARNALVVRAADGVIAIGGRVGHAVGDRVRAQDRQARGRPRELGSRRSRRVRHTRRGGRGAPS